MLRDDDWHPRALIRLETLDSREGLDQLSLAWAKELLLELKQHDIKPDRIIRSAEDTIAMWFKNEVRAHIECCDDGYVLSIIDEKNTHVPFESASSIVGALITAEAKEVKKKKSVERGAGGRAVTDEQVMGWLGGGSKKRGGGG